MSKYIDADHLKVEIKRQKHELELSIQSQGDYGQSCHIVAYENIISLIDSLQQEQPEVDIRSELEKYIFPISVETMKKEPFTQLEKCAHYFYDLGLNARKDILDIIDSLQQEQESVAERFARIVRGNLIGIDEETQQKFERLYFEITGNKMYGGYND